jgi:hypothetical protein
MPTWIIIVILLSIAATALLASVLQRINAPAKGARRKADGGGESTPVAHDGSGRGDKHDNDAGDSSSDSGGGDGGGGD